MNYVLGLPRFLCDVPLIYPFQISSVLAEIPEICWLVIYMVSLHPYLHIPMKLKTRLIVFTMCKNHFVPKKYWSLSFYPRTMDISNLKVCFLPCSIMFSGGNKSWKEDYTYRHWQGLYLRPINDPEPLVKKAITFRCTISATWIPLLKSMPRTFCHHRIKFGHTGSTPSLS